jgi:hypothetical protein
MQGQRQRCHFDLQDWVIYGAVMAIALVAMATYLLCD